MQTRYASGPMRIIFRVQNYENSACTDFDLTPADSQCTSSSMDKKSVAIPARNISHRPSAAWEFEVRCTCPLLRFQQKNSSTAIPRMDLPGQRNREPFVLGNKRLTRQYIPKPSPISASARKIVDVLIFSAPEYWPRFGEGTKSAARYNASISASPKRLSILYS